MANLFPCPNPECDYEFDAEQLPAAAMVTCPLCRTRFPYRAKTKPVSQAESNFDDEPRFGDDEPDQTKPRVNRLVTPRTAPKSNKTQLYVMIFAGLALLTLVFVLAKVARDKALQPAKALDSSFFDLYNFKLDIPGEGWTLDDTMRNRVSVNCFAYRKGDSSAYAAMHVREYVGKDKQPRDPFRKELFNDMKKLLQPNFASWTTEPITRAELGGRAAEGLTFQAELDGEPVQGEVLITDFRGLGYIFIIWSKQELWSSVRGDLMAMRNKMKIADGRQDWKGKSPTQYFFEEGGTYQLEDEDGIWQKAEMVPIKDGVPQFPRDGYKTYAVTQEMLQGHDPNAKMLLRARYPAADARNARNILPSIDAIVMVLDKPAGNPLDEAVNYVKNRLKAEEGAEVVSFVEAKPPEQVRDLPANWTTLARFGSRNSLSRDAKKSFVVNALVQGNKLVILEVVSSELDSESMEPFMIRLAASLKDRR